MSATTKALAGVIAATLLTTSTAALARPWGPGWGYRGHGRYHHHHGSGVAGALLGGLVIGGAVAVIASAVEDASDRRVYGDRAPPLPPRGQPYSGRGGIVTQGEAVDACSAIALEETGGGHVNDITRAAPWMGGWQVEGVIDRGSADAAGYRALDRFSCSVRFGAVEDFRLGGAPTAWRN